MRNLSKVMKGLNGLTAKEKMDILDKINEEEIIQLYDGTICKSDLLHKLVKIDTLINCRRMDSIDFEERYNIELNEYGQIIEIAIHKNTHYFLLVESGGDVKTLKLKIDKIGNKEVMLTYVSRICSDINRHNCCAINGSKYLMGINRDAQVYQHIIVAIAYGLYDNLSYDEIYSLVVNHMDGDMWNNNISNLEMCTPQENSIHGFVLSFLKELGFNNSLSAKTAVKLRNCTKEQLMKLIV